MRNDHQQHRGGQQRGGRGQGQGQRGHQQQQPGRRNPPQQQGGQGYYNPDREGWGARGYGGGAGDQGVEDWERRDEEMDRGQYTAPLGHGDDTDWHDDESFGSAFLGDEAGRFPGRGSEAGSRDYGMGGYGTHGGAGTTGGQWGTQGSRGVGSYGGQGLGGGPGGYYGQGYGQRQGGTIGGPSSGGMGWRGEPSWQGGQHLGGQQGQQGMQHRFERGPKGYKRSDDRIKEEVSDRIYQLQHVDSSDVEVEVKEGMVTLTGTIPNRIMKWQLENLVESIGGVTDVNNQLRIRKQGGFMQELQSTAQSAMNALKPGDGNKNPSDTADDRNMRRSGGTTGSQDQGVVTRK